MAEMGSKGVTAGKIASNVQKKLTRAQEKVSDGKPATPLTPTPGIELVTSGWSWPRSPRAWSPCS